MPGNPVIIFCGLYSYVVFDKPFDASWWQWQALQFSPFFHFHRKCKLYWTNHEISLFGASLEISSLILGHFVETGQAVVQASLSNRNYRVLLPYAKCPKQRILTAVVAIVLQFSTPDLYVHKIWVANKNPVSFNHPNFDFQLAAEWTPLHLYPSFFVDKTVTYSSIK